MEDNNGTTIETDEWKRDNKEIFNKKDWWYKNENSIP